MTLSATAEPQVKDPARKLKTHTLIVTSLGYFIVILDATAKNVALPQIGADLHAGISSLQWIIDSYLVAFAAFLLTAGALSDRFGARRVFSAGLAVFGAGSALSAVGVAPGLIVGFQALAGLGAALVTPASLALLASTFTDPAERGKALGIWATVAGAGTALGPLVGGALVDVAGWQSVFLVNVPIALAGIIMVRQWLPEAARNPSRSADVSGQVAGIVTLVALSYGVVNAGNHGWGSLGTLGALAAAVVAGCAFVAIELRVSAPMLPLGLLRSTRLSSSVLAGGTINFGTFGLFFLLTLYFQEHKRLSPLLTGLAELPMSSVCVFVPLYAGRLVARIGPRVPLAGGLALAGIGALGLRRPE